MRGGKREGAGKKKAYGELETKAMKVPAIFAEVLKRSFKDSAILLESANIAPEDLAFVVVPDPIYSAVRELPFRALAFHQESGRELQKLEFEILGQEESVPDPQDQAILEMVQQHKTEILACAEMHSQHPASLQLIPALPNQSAMIKKGLEALANLEDNPELFELVPVRIETVAAVQKAQEETWAAMDGEEFAVDNPEEEFTACQLEELIFQPMCPARHEEFAQYLLDKQNFKPHVDQTSFLSNIPEMNVQSAINRLKSALKLRANSGGAIKAEICDALELLGIQVEKKGTSYVV